MKEETKRKTLKGLHIALTVLIVLVFIVGIMVMVMVFSRSKDGIPRLFGVTALDIQTDSMAGGDEPIYPGDLAFIHEIKNPQDLKVGDVVTFWDFIGGKRVLNTHRIIEVRVKGERFILMGTNENIDPTIPGNTQDVLISQIIGQYSMKWSGMGYVVRFLSSGWGFFLCIFLPLLLFLGYRIFVLIRVIMALKKEKAEPAKDVEELQKELEELKAKLAAVDEGGEAAPAPMDVGAEADASGGGEGQADD